MCSHNWNARQPSSLGASYLCSKCGAQLDRVFDHALSEEEADLAGTIDEIVRIAYTDTSLVGFDVPF